MKISTYYNSDTGFRSRLFRESNGKYLIAIYAPPLGLRVPFCDRRVENRDLARGLAIAVLELNSFTETRGS